MTDAAGLATTTWTAPPPPFTEGPDRIGLSAAPSRLGGYEVADLVPSGLAPLARTDGWVGEDGTIGPYRIVGQEVDFSTWNDPQAIRVTKMRYLARIVTPGDYAWEPASIRLAAAPQDAAFTIPTRITIADR